MLGRICIYGSISLICNPLSFLWAYRFFSLTIVWILLATTKLPCFAFYFTHIPLVLLSSVTLVTASHLFFFTLIILMIVYLGLKVTST